MDLLLLFRVYKWIGWVRDIRAFGFIDLLILVIGVENIFCVSVYVLMTVQRQGVLD